MTHLAVTPAEAGVPGRECAGAFSSLRSRFSATPKFILSAAAGGVEGPG
ncbi:MAG: hypothetical protein JWO81_727 [Alphaproteobacteria bacterium]|nr:hypothetical protein [Alphaproteobacteria bacterium]